MEDLNKKKEQGNLSKHGYYLRERYFMRKFYCQDIDADLIILDDQGRYREKIRMYEKIISSYWGISDEKPKFLFKIFQIAGVINRTGKFDEKIITKDSLSNFSEYSINHSMTVQRLFNLVTRKDVIQDPISQLKLFLNLCGIKLKKTNSKSTDGKKTYQYLIDSESFFQINELIRRRAENRDLHIDSVIDQREEEFSNMH